MTIKVGAIGTGGMAGGHFRQAGKLSPGIVYYR